MTPLSRWQMTQRSVHTAQPGMPDCVDAPAGACGNSGAAGGDATGASAARAATTIMAAARLAIERIDTCVNEPCRIGVSSRRGRATGRKGPHADRPNLTVSLRLKNTTPRVGVQGCVQHGWSTNGLGSATPMA